MKPPILWIQLGSHLLSSAQTVTIKAGDTCNSIAKAIGTTVQDIFSNNPEVNSKCTNLKIGANLKVTAVKGNAAGNKPPAVDSTAAQCNTTAPAQQNNGIAGAVYCAYPYFHVFLVALKRSSVMTNEAKGNFLVASAIGADGKIVSGPYHHRVMILTFLLRPLPRLYTLVEKVVTDRLREVVHLDLTLSSPRIPSKSEAKLVSTLRARTPL